MTESSTSQSAPARTAALVGCGNVGMPTLLLLLISGLYDRVFLIDPDVVEASNLRLQLFRPEDVGRTKVEAAAALAGRLRPDVELVRLAVDCRNLGPGFWRESDVIIGCIDSLAVEAWLGDMARLVGRPLLRGATSGAHVRGGSATARLYPAGDGPCPRCSWGAAAHRMADVRVSCITRALDEPTAGHVQVAHEGFLAAGLLAKALARDGLYSGKLQVAGPVSDLSAYSTPWSAREDCPGRHRGADVQLEVPWADGMTLTDLAAAASASLDEPVTSAWMELQPIARYQLCLRCGAAGGPSAVSFPRGAPCPSCGSEEVYRPETSLIALDPQQPLAPMPLVELGLPPRWGAVFRTAGRREALVTLRGLPERRAEGVLVKEGPEPSHRDQHAPGGHHGRR